MSLLRTTLTITATTLALGLAAGMGPRTLSSDDMLQAGGSEYRKCYITISCGACGIGEHNYCLVDQPLTSQCALDEDTNPCGTAAGCAWKKSRDGGKPC